MTAESVQTEAPPAGLISITVPDVPTVGDKHGDTTPFQLPPCCTDPEACTHDVEGAEWPPEVRNGVLWAVRPKNLLLMLIAAKVQEGNEDGTPGAKLPAYRNFLDSAVTPETNEVIWARLGDPTDQLDEPHMDALLSAFLTKWVPGRPTGPAAGSPTLQRGTGRPSTGRSRSTGRTRRA